MAQDEPGLAYADYFAAAGAGAGAVATLVPEVDDAIGGDGEEDHHLHLYGVHHHGPSVDMFGASRGHMPPAAMMGGPAAAHDKAALGLGGVDVASPVVGGHDFGDHHHHRQGLLQQAPLSLSLHGAADADAVSLALHQHLAGGGVPRQHHQPAAAWPQQQGGAWHLRGSRFLRPTQQLLQEFCALPVDTTTTTTTTSAAASKLPPTKPASEDGVGFGVGVGSSSSAAPSAQIQAMSASDLQRLKAKLFAMLQEVVLLAL